MSNDTMPIVKVEVGDLVAYPLFSKTGNTGYVLEIAEVAEKIDNYTIRVVNGYYKKSNLINIKQVIFVFSGKDFAVTEAKRLSKG